MDDAAFAIPLFLLFVSAIAILALSLSYKELKKQIETLKQNDVKLREKMDKTLQEYNSILKEYLDAKTNGTISYPLEKEIQELFNNNLSDKSPKQYLSSLMADFLTIELQKAENTLKNSRYIDDRRRAPKIAEMRETASKIVREAVLEKYSFEERFVKGFLSNRSNLDTIPYMSFIYADLCTADFAAITQWLSWYSSSADLKKAASITALRENAHSRIEQLKWSEYQLNYLLTLYPTLQEVIETETSQLELSVDEVQDFDPVRKFLTTEEWKALSETERNQLALDRYVESHKKSKWQIGRDYELFVGHTYRSMGYKVDFYGTYMGLEDLGRDLICKKGSKTLIVQCKYWSKEKQIHEKHIMQLFGSLTQYKIEHSGEKVSGVLVTNITLSEVARKFAEALGISFSEGLEFGEFPRIKCNIGHDEKGNITKIYHLPMDQQYDKTKIDQPGERLVYTVAEAEAKGFRRAHRWHSRTEA